MTTERDDIGGTPGAAALADGRGYGLQRRRTEMDSRRRQRRIVPVAIGAALLAVLATGLGLALQAGVIANQAGGPAAGSAGETSPASAPVAYCAAVYQRNDALYRACAVSAEPAPVEDRPGPPAAPTQRRAPAQDPAWFDAQDYGMAVPSPAATDGDEGPCRKPWRACDR